MPSALNTVAAHQTDWSAARKAASHVGMSGEFTLIRVGDNSVFRFDPRRGTPMVFRVSPIGGFSVAGAVAPTVLGNRGHPVVASLFAPIRLTDRVVTVWPLREVIDARDPWTTMGRVMANIHADSVPLLAALKGHPLLPAGSIRNCVDVDLDRAERRVAALTGKAELLGQHLIGLQARLPTIPGSAMAVCHGDLTRGNLVGGHLIDWDQMGLAAPEWDAAAAAMTARRFRAADALDQYIAGYHDGGGSIDIGLVDEYIPFWETRTALWLLGLAAQTGNSRLQAEADGRADDVLQGRDRYWQAA